MATAALAVGLAIAGLFVLIVAGVIVAFCVYLHKSPTKQMTRVKEIKNDTSNIKRKADVKKHLAKGNKEDRGSGGRSRLFGVCGCTCCCGSRDGIDEDDDGHVTTETLVIPVDRQVVPNPPDDVILKDPDAKSVTVTWSIPDRDYVERFQIFKRLAKKASTWTKVKTLRKTDARLCRLEKLETDVRYVFGVVAKNAAGKSSVAESVPIELKQKPVLPGPPSELVTWQKSGTTLTLSWKPPKFDGHLRTLRYHITMRDENMEWVTVARLQAFDRFMDYRVAGLTQNVPYRFRVAAENDVGTGVPVETKDVLLHNGPVPPDKPKGPLQYSDITHSSISVTWQEPEYDGGQPISGYAIELLDANQEKWKKVGVVPKNKKRFWINKLSEGSHYFVRVVAISNVGNSQPLTGSKFRTKFLEIPLHERASVTSMHNIISGQSRGTPGAGKTVPGSPGKSLRSLNASGLFIDDVNENSSSTNRARTKRSRSGKQKNVVTTHRIQNETRNDARHSARSRKYGASQHSEGIGADNVWPENPGQSSINNRGANSNQNGNLIGQVESIETVDKGVETLGAGLATVDIGVETDRDRVNSIDTDNISTEVSSVYDYKPKGGKFHYLNHTVHTNIVPSNVSYAFR